MKIITTIAALALLATPLAAETTGTKTVVRGFDLQPAQARAMLPETLGGLPLDISAFQCPIVNHGAYWMAPAIARDMRQQVQVARRGSTLVEREIPNPDFPGDVMSMTVNGHPEVIDIPEVPPTITVEVWDQDSNVRGASSIVIGDVMFSFNEAVGRCDLSTYEEFGS